MGRPRKKLVFKNEVVKEDVKVVEKNENKLVCMKCGSKNQANFYATSDKNRSVFKKLPYCKDCCLFFYNRYLAKHKDTNLAVYYFCRKVDIPYIHTAYKGAVEALNNPKSTIQGETALLSAYFRTISFSEANGWGFTFDETQGENEIQGITSFADVIKVKRNTVSNEVNTDKYELLEYDVDELIQKWGITDIEDLTYVESEYLDWEEKLNGITDKSTNILVKQVCLQCNAIRKSRESGSDVDKQLATLQTLLKNSGLINLQSDSDSANTIGMAISEIEYRRPIKKIDPELEDVDNIKTILYGFIGAMCRTLGKENAYTEKFDTIYDKYSIDIISDLKKIKEEDLGSKKTAGVKDGTK